MTEVVTHNPEPPEVYDLVEYTVGNHTFQGRRVVQCHVCTHPQRDSIEYMLAISGTTYQAIIRSHTEVPGRPLSYRSIKNHIDRGHMNHVLGAKRMLIEEAARERGLNLEEGVASLVTTVALAQEVVQKTYRMVAEGALMPSIQDGLSAGALVDKLTRETTVDGVDQARLRAIMDRYLFAAKNRMPYDDFMALCSDLANDPELMNLIAGSPVVSARGSVVDAEVVDETPQGALSSGSFD